MDSPHLQSSPNFLRARTNSNLSVHSAANPAGIRKRSVSRARSVSATQVEHLEHLSLDQSTTPDLHPHSIPQPFPEHSINLQWLTPQHSPQPQLFPDTCCIESFPQWNVPTPPRSDSGVPTLAVDSNEEITTSGVSNAQSFGFEPVTTTVEMRSVAAAPMSLLNVLTRSSSLGFLLPSQYGGGLCESDVNSMCESPSACDHLADHHDDYTMDQSYSSIRSQPATSGPNAYGQTLSSSPALYHSRPAPPSNSVRRHSEFPSSNSTDSSYTSNYRRISSPYDSTTSSEYSMSTNQSIPSIGGLTQSPLPSPHLGSTSTAAVYNQGVSRSSGLYDSSNMYGQPLTTAPSATQLYASTQSMSYPPAFVGSSANEVMAKPAGSDSSVRVLNQRPKPQCWEHGCNGRQFSTFSNLLRHQREKSGTASKSYCPKCGAEFTRTTARNGHLAHDKCTKPRRPSEEKSM